MGPAGASTTRRMALAGVASSAAALLGSAPGRANPGDVIGSVVGVAGMVPESARTAGTLGRERHGSGTLLDNGGLVLTLGRLILEAGRVEVGIEGDLAVPASIVAYDEVTCLGLVRTTSPLQLKPAALGKSGHVQVGEPLLAISAGDTLRFTEVRLVARRPFAASWEFALDEALFTAPQHPDLAGAALVDLKGMLIGVGAVAIPGKTGAAGRPARDVFVPVDALKTALGELLAMGHRDAPPRPWLGLKAEEGGGRLRVSSVALDGPAAHAGLLPGDTILNVGGQEVHTLGALWHGVWSLGSAGTTIPLGIRRGDVPMTIQVVSISHREWLRWPQSF